MNLCLNLAIPNWVCGIGKNDFFWMMGDCAGFVYHGMVKPCLIKFGILFLDAKFAKNKNSKLPKLSGYK
jgi:hypothetical protein